MTLLELTTLSTSNKVLAASLSETHSINLNIQELPTFKILKYCALFTPHRPLDKCSATSDSPSPNTQDINVV